MDPKKGGDLPMFYMGENPNDKKKLPTFSMGENPNDRPPTLSMGFNPNDNKMPMFSMGENPNDIKAQQMFSMGGPPMMHMGMGGPMRMAPPIEGPENVNNDETFNAAKKVRSAECMAIINEGIKDAFNERAYGLLMGAFCSDSCGSYLEFYGGTQDHELIMASEEVLDKCMTMPGGGYHRVAPG